MFGIATMQRGKTHYREASPLRQQRVPSVKRGTPDKSQDGSRVQFCEESYFFLYGGRNLSSIPVMNGKAVQMSDEMPVGAAEREAPLLPGAGDLMAAVSYYQSPLLRYVTRMLGGAVSQGESEDIVQETFIRLHRQVSGHGSGSIEHLTTWLFRVAHNLVLDALRRRQRHDVSQAAMDPAAVVQEQAEEMDALGEIIRQEARQVVLRALNELDESYRQVVLLKVVQGMSLRQVADVVGVSVSTINYRLNQGLGLLAQRLRKAGVV
jgi:RNA polymerase sigma factor (sigma-70 family)